MSNRLVHLELYPLEIPLRRAQYLRDEPFQTSQHVIMAALLADGTVGYGEGMPNPSVAGETVDSILYNLQYDLADELDRLEPKSFSDLLDFADQLAFENEHDQRIHGARCCLELALLDAYAKHFQARLSGVQGWLGYAPFMAAAEEQPRVSGLLDAVRSKELRRDFRRMRWFGLQEFKIHMTAAHHDLSLDIFDEQMQKRFFEGALTLRVDAQGCWDVDQAVDMSERLNRIGVCCLEQPLAVDDYSHYQTLTDLIHIPTMADESLVSLDDGDYLARNDLVDFFNISINKNGGLLAAIRLAELADKWFRGYQLGAACGETGVLAAAGLRFLQVVPNTSFTEIGYGEKVLKNDIIDRKLTFGFGGRLSGAAGPGLGANVDLKQLRKFLIRDPVKIDLA
jgi:muconate cycloisomerase